MDRKHVTSLVLKKLSLMLVNQSIPFLGLRDLLETIETKLREVVNSEFFDCEKEFAYEIEDIVDFLVARSATKRGGFLQNVIDRRKLRKKLNRIKLQIFQETDKVSPRTGMDLLPPCSRKQLDVGESVVSPVIKKVTALGNRQQLISRAVKRRTRWVRDDLRLLHVILKESEWKEMRREEMVWMEEVCLFCKLAGDVIGSFLSPKEQSSSRRSCKRRCFLNLCLAFAPYKSRSERKILRNLDQMNAKLKTIIRRFHELVDRFQIPPPRNPPNESPPPRRPPGDAISLSSFDDDDDQDNNDGLDEAEDGRPQPLNSQNEQTQPTLDANAGAQKQPDITGHQSNVDEIMEFLLRNDSTCLTVSIVGMEGIGKTELASSIYEHSTIRDRFPHRSWINWVRDSNFHRFMEQIVGAPYTIMTRGLSVDRQDYFKKVRKLLNDFLMDKRYLFVIDGVTSKLVYKQLGAAFDGLLCGTRIIYVSSKLGVTEESSERNFTCRLQLWSDDECWALFVRSLKNQNANIALEQVKMKKKEILRACAGLPKAISELAQLLSREIPSPEDCSRVLETFNKDQGTWSPILQEVDEKLPLYLRRCLYYFRLFPDNFEIPARRLIGLWVAEGFGDQKNGDEDSPEKLSEKLLIELANRNMIQVTKKKRNGEIKACRLPDALRVHWLLKDKEANGHFDDNVYSSGGRVGRLVDHLDLRHPSFDHIHGDSTAPSFLSRCYRGTVSFLSFDTRQGSRPGQDVGTFLEKCISSKCFSSLWVLDLENVYRPKLPEAISRLIRLKYLGLRSTYLEILPLFINKLLKLETLDLNHTSINTLPSSIWMMKELRHLFLDSGSCCTFPPPPKGSCLADMQTLWGAFLNEDSPVRDGLDRFLRIRKLSLICKMSDSSQNEAMASQLNAIASWVLKLTHLRTLKLKSFNELGQPSDIQLETLSGHMDLSSIHLVGNLKNQYLVSEFPDNLIELTLSASALVEDPMQMLDKLPMLRILRLFSGAFAGTKMVCTSGGFPKLQVLKLWELEPLEEWNIEEGAMPSLKCLEIRSCRNLNVIPDGLQYVKTLNKLKLKDMALLSARIYDNQGEDWDKVAHVLHVYTEN